MGAEEADLFEAVALEEDLGEVLEEAPDEDFEEVRLPEELPLRDVLRELVLLRVDDADFFD